jgi:hypothetical protein
VKILLDENLDHRLRRHLGAHDVYTVDYMQWAGLKNGELLRAAEEDGFEVFLTGDKNLAYQQNLAARRIAIVTVSAIELHILKPNLSLIIAAIESVTPGAFLTVECGNFRRQDG